MRRTFNAGTDALMIENRRLTIHCTTRQLYGWVGAILVLLAGAALLGYFYADGALSQYKKNSQQLHSRLSGLEENLAASQSTVTRLQLSAEVDTAALEATRQQLVELQRQIYRRDQELKLYREMLQDNHQPDGLSVSDLHLKKIGDRRFSYHWVARQKIDKVKTLRANAKLWVVGQQQGKVVSLPLDLLDVEIDALPIKLRLKYFSINRGVLQLPEGFAPEAVRVTLRYPWMEQPQFDKKFVWFAEE